MRKPGSIRDAIIEHLKKSGGEATVEEIHASVQAKMGEVARSSVRSYLSLNSPAKFERMGHGRYRLSRSTK